MKQAVILSAVRTPVGRFGGTLSQVTDRTLGALVIREAIARAGITPDQVEELVFSQQYRTGELPPNMARPVAVDAGIPISVPQFTVAKACGGSLKTVFLAAQAIKAGDSDLMVAGGVESMSGAAYLLPKARFGYRLGHGQLMDQLVLFDPISGNTMGETAENVAERYQVSREDQDHVCAVQSKEGWKGASGKALCGPDRTRAYPGEKGRNQDFRHRRTSPSGYHGRAIGQAPAGLPRRRKCHCRELQRAE